jgi:hypothetical protein
MSDKEQNLKEIIKQEFIKCCQDPVHFMKKYCWIQHPKRGRIMFHLFPFQEKTLNVFKDHDYSIILKSRQLGISTLSAGFALWLMLFHKDKNVLCIATKQDTAKNLVDKVQFMYDNLPSWLKEKTIEKNKLSMKLANGSKIKAVSAAGDSGRSEAVSLLLIDEAAFIDSAEDIWASAQQTLASGGKAIVLSTPNGTGNWFHKVWGGAELKENNFIPIRLPWYVHPERNEEWRKKQEELLGARMAAQECDCDFATSGHTFFLPEYIDFYEKTYIINPIEQRGFDKNLWIWDYVDYSKQYMILADVARGDGEDFSTIHVMDIETNTQVAEYKGQLPPKEFALLLIGVATEYNYGLIVVENSTIGWGVLDVLIERGYSNLYYSSKRDTLSADSFFNPYDDPSDLVPGFTNSLKTRPVITNKMNEYVMDKSVVFRSKRLLSEMKTFIWKNGRPEAQSGYNDDLIIPMAIGLHLRDTALRFKQNSVEQSRAALSGIQSTKNNYVGSYMSNGVPNPYQVNTGKGIEDFRWLLNK